MRPLESEKLARRHYLDENTGRTGLARLGINAEWSGIPNDPDHPLRARIIRPGQEIAVEPSSPVNRALSSLRSAATSFRVMLL